MIGCLMANPILSLLTLVLMTLASCATGIPEGGMALKNTGPADLHSVSDQRLRTIMQGLKSLTIDRFDSELEIEKQEQRYYREMASIAEAVGHSASLIPESGAIQELSPKQKKQFSMFARRLSEQANAMKRLADGGNGRALRSSMRRMIATCNACHDRFRNMNRDISR